MVKFMEFFRKILLKENFLENQFMKMVLKYQFNMKCQGSNERRKIMKNICILFFIVFFCSCGNSDIQNEKILKHNLYENENTTVPKDDDDISIGTALIASGIIILGILEIIATSLDNHNNYSNSNREHNKPNHKPVHKPK